MSGQAEISDARLVARCRQGDEVAWRELVERYSRYVYAITQQAYRLSLHDAEDVFQEVFARTFQHLHRLRDDGAIRPWIGQLTRRLCIDRLRQGDREQPSETAEESPTDDET
ncbi:MAG: RNA polymerase sigma factor, partial [Gaiellales bacterium]